MSSSQVSSTEVYQLATQYGLGTPQWRHARDGQIWGIFFAVLLLGLAGLCACLLLIILLIPNFFSTPGALTLVIAVVVVTILAIWIGLALLVNWKETLRYCAYECSLGFIELYQPGRRVILAMRWDDIRRVQMVQRKWRLRPEFYITHWQGRLIRIRYLGIWHRCQEEMRRRPHDEQLRVWR